MPLLSRVLATPIMNAAYTPTSNDIKLIYDMSQALVRSIPKDWYSEIERPVMKRFQYAVTSFYKKISKRKLSMSTRDLERFENLRGFGVV